MGKSTISMAIFNSYFDITRGYFWTQLPTTTQICQESSPHWASIQTPPSSMQQDPPQSWNRVRHGCSYPPDLETVSCENPPATPLRSTSLKHPYRPMKRVLERLWESMRQHHKASSFSYVQIFPKWIKGWKHVFAARHRSLWHHDPITIVHGHVIVQQDIFEMESANAPILAISACTARKNRSRKNRLSAAPCHTNSIQFPRSGMPRCTARKRQDAKPRMKTK